MVFHRLEIRSKAMNVAEIKSNNIKRKCQDTQSHQQRGSQSWGYLWSPSQMGTPRSAVVKPF